MPYLREEYWLQRTIEVEKKHTGKYGAPGQKRQKRKKATPEEIKKQNEYNRVKKLRRKIGYNFNSNDWYITLTYKKENRPTTEKAKKILREFLDYLRKEYKKRGQPLKYIIVTEWKNKAIHHHIIINHIVDAKTDTSKLIHKKWKYGGKHFQHLYEDGDFKKLAEYLVKETKDTKQESESPSRLSYSCSRNLEMPKPKKKILRRKQWDEPKPRKGYYIDKDSIIEGVNPITGYHYQHYIMIKIESEEGAG